MIINNINIYSLLFLIVFYLFDFIFDFIFFLYFIIQVYLFVIKDKQVTLNVQRRRQVAAFLISGIISLSSVPWGACHTGPLPPPPNVYSSGFGVLPYLPYGHRIGSCAVGTSQSIVCYIYIYIYNTMDSLWERLVDIYINIYILYIYILGKGIIVQSTVSR